jgi:hypothetical protein
MNNVVRENRVEASYEAFQQQRAQDKYDGKVGGDFPLKEFRKCADYLAGVLEKTTFDAEDLGDVVRVALSRRGHAASARDEPIQTQDVVRIGR